MFVSLSFFGVVLITLSDLENQSKTGHSLRGDLVTLGSALFFSLYACMLPSKISQNEEAAFRFSWFLGFVGLINTIITLPALMFAHRFGFETFEVPNSEALLCLCANAILGTVISDYCQARAVILLNPLIVTMGYTLAISIGMIASVCF